MIPKHDGSRRFCVDYRQLNKITLLDPHPIPRIDDISDRLQGSKWFSTLDLKCGYWQGEVEPDSIAKTAFNTPDGHYEWFKLPFGLKNAPSDFARSMQLVFGNLLFVEVYLDDITVHSKTLEEHCEHLTIVANKIKEVDLRINPDKCTWLAKSVKLLGHIISENGVSMDPEKVEAIQSIKPPKNVKQVQQFLGICNYYRKFVKDFSSIAAPMYNLLKKDVKFIWTQECEEAFQLLKSFLMSQPIIRQPVYTQPFILYTDASALAIGANLSQVDADNNEYVCFYASRLLKGAELHYTISEKECLAVIYAVKFFRIYLFGQNFKVVTDHSALTWLMSIKNANGRLMRWSLYLQEYEFQIFYRKGRQHTNVDILSRPVLLVTRSMA
jgi:hypothetical protein